MEWTDASKQWTSFGELPQNCIVKSCDEGFSLEGPLDVCLGFFNATVARATTDDVLLRGQVLHTDVEIDCASLKLLNNFFSVRLGWCRCRVTIDKRKPTKLSVSDEVRSTVVSIVHMALKEVPDSVQIICKPLSDVAIFHNFSWCHVNCHWTFTENMLSKNDVKFCLLHYEDSFGELIKVFFGGNHDDRLLG